MSTTESPEPEQPVAYDPSTGEPVPAETPDPNLAMESSAELVTEEGTTIAHGEQTQVTPPPTPDDGDDEEEST
jgi:hypothetical protein